jgi:hypothetical protein
LRILLLVRILQHLCAPGLNFINILCARVFRTNVVLADFSSYVYLEKAAETTFVQKMRAFYVDEIDGRSQFHQHLMRKFFL